MYYRDEYKFRLLYAYTTIYSVLQCSIAVYTVTVMFRGVKCDVILYSCSQCCTVLYSTMQDTIVQSITQLYSNVGCCLERKIQCTVLSVVFYIAQ